MTASAEFLSSVEHIMDVEFPVISASDSIAAARLITDRVNGEPVAVVDDRGGLKGILTSEALLLDSSMTAGQVATNPRLTVAPHESAFGVVSRMLNRRVDWAPVVREGKLIGTVSRECIRSAFGESHSV